MNEEVPVVQTDFRGVWYGCGKENALPNRDFVYAGAAATYSAWHHPMAVYAPEVKRTFFVFGDDRNRPAVSFYDHANKTFAQPFALGTNPDGNAHRNPTLMLDEDGFLYVFYGYHGAKQPIQVLRSSKPFEIVSWIRCTNLTDGDGSYAQPWPLRPGEITAAYRQSAGWCFRKSVDKGNSWSPAVSLATFDTYEHTSTVYGITRGASGPYPRRIHFAWSKLGGGSAGTQKSKPLWARRYNVYYACSDDGGGTWRRSDGTPLTLPITEATVEKIYDSGEHGVWLKDLQIDDEGNPCILFLDADIDTYASTWKMMRHGMAGHGMAGWTFSDITTSDHMYDEGALVLLSKEDFRVYGPSTPSQAKIDGGEIEEWTSQDQGRTWKNTAHITTGSTYAHNHVKTVFNHQQGDGAFRMFWSYGDAQSPPKTPVVSMFCYGEAQTKPRLIEVSR